MSESVYPKISTKTANRLDKEIKVLVKSNATAKGGEKVAKGKCEKCGKPVDGTYRFCSTCSSEKGKADMQALKNVINDKSAPGIIKKIAYEERARIAGKASLKEAKKKYN